MSDAASALERLRAELAATKAELARSEAVVSASEAMIAGLKLEIALLRREKYGRSAERTARLIDQLELQLEELETAAAEDAIRAETAAEKTTTVRGFDRRKPVRKPFPAHLPRERVVVEAPTGCSCCGSPRLVKMGEDLTETLEVVPRKWKVIQTVREKFTCRDCEKISQPPAPFHPIPRGGHLAAGSRGSPQQGGRRGPTRSCLPACRARHRRSGASQQAGPARPCKVPRNRTAGEPPVSSP